MTTTNTNPLLTSIQDFFPQIVEMAMTTPMEHNVIIQNLIASSGINQNSQASNHAIQLHQLLMALGRNKKYLQRIQEQQLPVDNIFKLLNLLIEALKKCNILSDPSLQAHLLEIYKFIQNPPNNAKKEASFYDPLEVCGPKVGSIYDPLNVCGSDPCNSLLFSNEYECGF